MTDLASRATGSVNLPSLRQTRGRIIKSFKQQMLLLQERLNVSYPCSPSFFELILTLRAPP